MGKTLTLLCVCLLVSTQALFTEGKFDHNNNPAPAQRTFNTGAFFNDALARMDSAFNESELTLEDEYYLGRSVAANILSVYKPYYGKPELTLYLNRICQTLVINSSQVEIYNGYHVIILDSAEYNAFASPGGHILITRGLIDLCTSEDMLAAIIAHELAHIMLKHGVSLINDMKLSTEMASLANLAAELAGRNNASVQRLMEYRSSVSTITDTMMKNGYSQSYEFQADREAVALLAAAGYEPTSIIDVLLVLQRVQASQRGGFNTTHPSPAQRIVYVERVTGAYSVPDTRSSRSARFKEATGSN